MSAITGIFYRDERFVKHNQIKKMNDSLSHRGSDGSKVWCEGSVALGHQMLYTTPESLHETLPFEEKDLFITADARIDNRKELSERLGIDNKEDVSDSYYILKSYQKWGEKCPEELLGDFAFAIWDKKNDKIFCARDHMGVKPFYYYLSNKVFFFGTEIKSILSNPEVPTKLNELKVAHHLIPIFTDRKLTFYENIYRLPAAHTLTITTDNDMINNYWQLDPKLEFRANSNEEYYEKFREIFEESIRCRLRSNYKIGFELSGGIDSSSVICTAKRLFDENTIINSFSIIFNEIKEVDESYYINKVIDTGGIKSHLLVADSISPLKEMENIFYFQDEPPSTPNASMIWQLYKEMNKNDIRITLGGNDGDCALYKGENYFRELFINFNWIKLINEINGYSKRKDYNPLKVFIGQVIFPIIPEASNIWNKYKKIRKEQDFSIINNEFERRLNLKEHLKEVELIPFKEANNSKKTHHYFLTLATHQYIFEMMDKYAGALNIEPRHPMMDKRLLEYCYSIPTEIKFNNGWDRLLARIGLAEVLPKEVQWRIRKFDFFPVFERNLLLFEKENIDDLINERKICPYVDSDEIYKIYSRYKNGSNDADPIDLWKIIILSMWLKKNQYLKSNEQK
jgi:asparagine synthase (glutamine-hydrolysing)